MKGNVFNQTPWWNMLMGHREQLTFVGLIGVFLAAYVAPLDAVHLGGPMGESLHLLQEYVREHVLFCLVPAFFIAGAIANFLSQDAVMKYFGADAKKWLSYSIASVSGTILAVCSCTVLPLFAGIYRRGAGIGPAIAFLYSGPAINLLAVILTARVIGWQLGLARAIGAVVFSIVIGLIMALLYRGDEMERKRSMHPGASGATAPRSPGQTLLYFFSLVLILIFASWGSRPEVDTGFWSAVHSVKWILTGVSIAALLWMLTKWFEPHERSGWLDATWTYAKQILPLLFVGVLVAGALLGRPGSNAGLIPSSWVAQAVGGNSLGANLFASVAGAFMYFATLTEVPILQGLIGSGMGQGPALALLLAGPALSLPNMLVIRSILGTKRTVTFVILVVAMATLSGMVFGTLVA